MQGGCICACAGLGGRRTARLAGVLESQGRKAEGGERVRAGPAGTGVCRLRPRLRPRGGKRGLCAPPPSAPVSAWRAALLQGIRIPLPAGWVVGSWVSRPPLSSGPSPLRGRLSRISGEVGPGQRRREGAGSELGPRRLPQLDQGRGSLNQWKTAAERCHRNEFQPVSLPPLGATKSECWCPSLFIC